MSKQILPISDITGFAGTAIACILTAVYGLSGIPNVIPARILLLVSWICGLLHFLTYSFISNSLLYFVGFALIWTVLLILLAFLLEPVLIPSDHPVLVEKRELWSPRNPNRIRILEIGDSGARLLLGDEVEKLFDFFGESDLTLEKYGRRILFSTTVYGSGGRLVAKIVRNKLVVSPDGFDFNYDKNSLEVRDSSGRILLQVRLLADLIQIQGEWWSRDGAHGVRFVSRGPGEGAEMLRLLPGPVPEETSIKPLFKYPAKSHFGERADSE